MSYLNSLTEAQKRDLHSARGYLERAETEKRELNKTAQTAYDVFETQPGAEFAKGTFWQAFNSVTYTMDHLYGRSADSRLQNSWFGTGAKTKLDAMKTALEMA
jgi:hypothetical protein